MKSPSASNLPEISQVIRSNRKSFSLEVKPDGRLIVRAPESATPSQINAVVAHKAGWIKKTQARLASTFPQAKPKTFTPGETFWYLGEQYSLRLTDRQRPPLDLEGSFYLSRAAQNRAREVFIDWYREETRSITSQLIKTYAKEYGFKVKQVRITSARTRWGSCSGKNNLNFTYRLCMAPLPVVEYVVVHELVHLKVRNHSSTFWKGVSAILPDYQTHRRWLKKNGVLLTLD
jgi:predicted metal-dependent hydrolase